jgi:hypothetical protein
MAMTVTLLRETRILNRPAKVYKLTGDAAATTADIKPGLEYTMPVGAYTDYTFTGETYTVTLPATLSASEYCTIVFFAAK